jgi:hypothetical protein
MHQLPELGNCVVLTLIDKYGGEARSHFIEKSILYTVSQFLPSLNQYRLYVRIGKHRCALLS